MRVGDVVEDSDKKRWIIIGIVYLNGRQVAQKVRVNSLAAIVHGYKDKE